MTDIVVRLRFWGDSYHLHKESADEIEKLRAALRDIARQPEGDEESAQAVARAALGEKE